MLIVSPCSAFY